MDKENAIITNSSRINLNGNHTQHLGLEFALSYDLSDSLTVHGVYNFANHTYENEQFSGGKNIQNNRVDTAPRTFGNLRLAWQPIEKIRSEIEVVEMGEYYTNPENSASYEGHTLVNLRGHYQYSDSINLSLNVMNVTDRDYAERADWSTYTGDRYFPGEPARVYFGIDLSY
jgi:outer membrane receptor protein involved in Fe transport